MTDSSRRCLRCQLPLDPGYLLDVGSGQLANRPLHQAQWVSGPPEPSFWTGLKLKDHTVLPVFADRCPRCGTIELRAG
jgi:hypothetical protein